MKILLLFLLFSTNIYAKLNIQHWTTPEGAKVLFVQTQGLPTLFYQILKMLILFILYFKNDKR